MLYGNSEQKPYPWRPIDDYNPDHRPSSSAAVYESHGDGVIAVLAVKHLGVLVLRADIDHMDPQGKLKFTGLSTFTSGEIGYTEKL